MIKINKYQTMIGENNKFIYRFDYKPEKVNNDEPIHHIHMLDRSGSMWMEIDDLIEDVKKTITLMKDNDYVSIIYFSSADECNILIQGARKDTDRLPIVLDSIKSTLSTTCFSTPFTKIKNIINDLYLMCPKININLFTDGEPVTNWSFEEEKSKILEAISLYKDKITCINTIGYGRYYNEKLLKDISSQSEFGLMTHSSRIKDYSEFFNSNLSRIKELTAERFSLEIKGSNCSNNEILYMNNKSSIYSKSNSLEIKSVDKKTNSFFIITESEDDFDILINGEIYNSKDAITGTRFFKDKLLYCLAYEHYYNGRRKEAFDILSKSLKDKYFVDTHLAAFTPDEVTSYTKELRKAIFGNSTTTYRRKTGLISDDYIPKNDTVCIMDVLNIILDGDNYYIPSNDYNRIGLKVEDTFNLFKKSDTDPRVPISEFVFNKEYLNLSIRCMFNGTVTLNPKAAKNANLPKEINSRIFRNHTVIKDGFLNIPRLKLAVDDKTLEKLVVLENRVEETKAKKKLFSFNGKKGDHSKVTIILENTPIINGSYLDEKYNSDFIHTLVKETTELEIKQKVLNYYIDKYSIEVPLSLEDKFRSNVRNLNEDQIKVLEEHGLSKDLTYNGVDNKVASKNENDFYLARTMKFSLKGFSNIPKIDDVLNRITYDMPLNAPSTIMAGFITKLLEDISCSGIKGNDFILSQLKEVKKNLVKNRTLLSSIKIAKVLNGDFFEDLVLNESNNKYCYQDLVVETSKKKVYF